MKNSGWYARLLACLLLVFEVGMVPGCGDKETPRAVKTVEKQKAKEEKAAPEGAEGAAKKDGGEEGERLTYSYNPIGKRDPFRSFITKDSVALENRPETPLQKYEIDQFHLVAIIWGIDDPVAMVEDPEGMGHFLRKGTLIGKNWGKVVRISPTEVIVAEEYRDFEGKLIVNEIPLKLPSEGYEQ